MEKMHLVAGTLKAKVRMSQVREEKLAIRKCILLHFWHRKFDPLNWWAEAQKSGIVAGCGTEHLQAVIGWLEAQMADEMEEIRKCY